MDQASKWFWVATFTTCSALFPARTHAQEIPFRIEGGFAIVAKGSVGELRNLNFLIDTGAVPSVVTPRIARKLGLRGASERSSLFTGSVEVQRVALPTLQLGSLSVDTLPAVVLDLTEVEQALATRIDAIVGLDVLHRLGSFVVDYDARKIVGGRVAAGSGLPFEWGHEGGAPFVVLPVQASGQKLRLLLDTGTRALYLFVPRARPAVAGIRAAGAVASVNAAGESTLREIELPAVWLGGRQFRRQKALIVNVAEEASRGLDGLIGPRALGLNCFGLDFERQLFFWEGCSASVVEEQDPPEKRSLRER